MNRRSSLLALLTLAALVPQVAPAGAITGATATFSKGTLTIMGKGGVDNLSVYCASGNVMINGEDPDTGPLLCAKVKKVVMNGGAKGDSLDATGLDPLEFTNLASVRLIGGPGDDDLNGSPIADSLSGGDGADRFVGGGGDDTIDGGKGNDQVGGYNLPGTLKLTDTRMVSPTTGTDRLRGIESFSGYGDSGFNTLDAAKTSMDVTYNAQDGGSLQTGGSGDDTLGGLFGNDVISGGKGDDSLEGRMGTNSLSGGPGKDRLYDYINANLVVTDTSVTGTGVTTSLSGIEFLHIAVEGSFVARTIDASAATIDTRLVGNSGADTLIGGSGDDILEPGFGTANDSMDGNGGDDEVYAYQLGDATVTAGVITSAENGIDTFADVELVTLDANTDQVTFDASAANVAVRYKAQGSGTNWLTGSPFDDMIFGSDGDDMLFGLAGDDLLNGKGGTDTCDGGPGKDTIKNCE